MSKLRQNQLQLLRLRNQGRRRIGFFEPPPQIPVGEQVQAQNVRHVREGPPRLRQVVEPLYNQQGDKGCLNLDAKGVLGGSDKGLNLQVLFQGIEEDLDLPSLLVE